MDFFSGLSLLTVKFPSANRANDALLKRSYYVVTTNTIIITCSQLSTLASLNPASLSQLLLQPKLVLNQGFQIWTIFTAYFN